MREKIVLKGTFATFSKSSYPYRIYGYPGHEDRKYKLSYKEWIEEEMAHMIRKSAIEYLISI